MTAAMTSESESHLVDPFTLLGLAGILFAVLGATDLVSQLFPLGLGSPDWEFGTYSSIMDSIPLFTMGIGFLGAYSVARAHRSLSLVLGIILILLAVLILGFAFLYATNLPQALRGRARTPAEMVIRIGLKKAVVKGALQTAIYPIAFLWMGIFIIRYGRRTRR